MKLWKTFSWMLILALAVGFIGCSEDDDDPVTPTTYDHFEALFDLDAKFGNNITGDDLMAEINAGEITHFIIDFRSADDYANAGHIENAVNWELPDLIDNRGQIPAGAKVICVCYSGQTASHASAALNMLDYDAWNLKFGMCGWTNDETVNLGKWANLTENTDIEFVTDAFTLDDAFDYPVQELESEDVMEAAKYYIDTYLDAGWKKISNADLWVNLQDGDASNDPVMLNYWPETMYVNGHFPGAVQMSPITLESLVGVDPSKQVIVYCHTGQTSSKIVLWLNTLGYDAYSLLYGVNAIDQSFPELKTYHGPSEDYPVVTGP